jgi:hypothetical protein
VEGGAEGCVLHPDGRWRDQAVSRRGRRDPPKRREMPGVDFRLGLFDEFARFWIIRV